MNNNAEQKPHLRSAENTVSLYEAAEIVFVQLKNNSENWTSIEQLYQDHPLLWIIQAEDEAYAEFTNLILIKTLALQPYTITEVNFPELSSRLTTQFYSEFFQAFNIQLEGNVEPFLVRLGMLVRKEMLLKAYAELDREWTQKKNEYLVGEENADAEGELRKFAERETAINALIRDIDSKMASRIRPSN